MNLLEMFKELSEEDKIEFINLMIDVINDCNSNHKPSNKYEVVCKIGHIKKSKKID